MNVFGSSVHVWISELLSYVTPWWKKEPLADSIYICNGILAASAKLESAFTSDTY